MRCHYLDAVRGCGQFLEEKCMKKYFQSLSRLSTMSIAAHEYTKQCVALKHGHISLAHSFTLLEAYAVALDWNYMARDFDKLNEINAIEVLRIDAIDMTQMFNP